MIRRKLFTIVNNRENTTTNNNKWTFTLLLQGKLLTKWAGTPIIYRNSSQIVKSAVVAPILAFPILRNWLALHVISNTWKCIFQEARVAMTSLVGYKRNVFVSQWPLKQLKLCLSYSNTLESHERVNIFNEKHSLIGLGKIRCDVCQATYQVSSIFLKNSSKKCISFVPVNCCAFNVDLTQRRIQRVAQGARPPSFFFTITCCCFFLQSLWRTTNCVVH